MTPWNKGTLTTPDNPGNSPLMQWIRDHRDYGGDYCLIWPFNRGRSGYGSYERCEYVNGPPPTPGHHAAHSCGRGQDGCVNPRHVSWKTNSENQLDRREHQTNRCGALSDDQVAAILDNTELAREAAVRYGVSETTIRQIRTGEIHNGLTKRRCYLTEEQRAVISQNVLYRMRREAIGQGK